MKALAAACLDAAALAGATYADVRITDTTTQGLTVRDGVVEGISSSDSIGFGIRVVADGAWGFASSFELTEGAARRVADQAVAIARASATVGGRPIVLADVPPRAALGSAHASSTRSRSASRRRSVCCSPPTHRCAPCPASHSPGATCGS
jgi:predicted Zn-dependent protease